MRYIPLLIVVLFAFGCGAADTQNADGGANAAQTESAVRMVDGVQVVEIEAGSRGFDPQQIELEAGVPARLVFERTTEAECLHHVSVPEFGVEMKPLPMHEEVAVEFTPEEDGEFTFVCGMGMQKGTLVVST